MAYKLLIKKPIKRIRMSKCSIIISKFKLYLPVVSICSLVLLIFSIYLNEYILFILNKRIEIPFMQSTIKKDNLQLKLGIFTFIENESLIWSFQVIFGVLLFFIIIFFYSFFRTIFMDPGYLPDPINFECNLVLQNLEFKEEETEFISYEESEASSHMQNNISDDNLLLDSNKIFYKSKEANKKLKSIPKKNLPIKMKLENKNDENSNKNYFDNSEHKKKCYAKEENVNFNSSNDNILSNDLSNNNINYSDISGNIEKNNFFNDKNKTTYGYFQEKKTFKDNTSDKSDDKNLSIDIKDKSKITNTSNIQNLSMDNVEINIIENNKIINNEINSLEMRKKSADKFRPESGLQVKENFSEISPSQKKISFYNNKGEKERSLNLINEVLNYGSIEIKNATNHFISNVNDSKLISPISGNYSNDLVPNRKLSKSSKSNRSHMLKSHRIKHLENHLCNRKDYKRRHSSNKRAKYGYFQAKSKNYKNGLDQDSITPIYNIKGETIIGELKEEGSGTKNSCNSKNFINDSSEIIKDNELLSSDNTNPHKIFQKILKMRTNFINDFGKIVANGPICASEGVKYRNYLEKYLNITKLNGSYTNSYFHSMLYKQRDINAGNFIDFDEFSNNFGNKDDSPALKIYGTDEYRNNYYIPKKEKKIYFGNFSYTLDEIENDSNSNSLSHYKSNNEKISPKKCNNVHRKYNDCEKAKDKAKSFISNINSNTNVKGQKNIITDNFEIFRGFEINKIILCTACLRWKLPRTHHCRSCGKCILKMDHHCPWLANCIGFKNYKFFCLTIIYGISLSMFVFLTFWEVALNYLYSSETDIISTSLVCLCYSFNFGLLIFLTYLLNYNFTLVLTNETIIEKADRERFMEGINLNPNYIPVSNHFSFDKGYYRNFTEVFGTNPFFWFLPIQNNLEYIKSFINTELL